MFGDPHLWPLWALEAACLVMVIVTWRRAAVWAKDGALIAPDNHPLQRYWASSFWLVLAAIVPMIIAALRNQALLRAVWERLI